MSLSDVNAAILANLKGKRRGQPHASIGAVVKSSRARAPSRDAFQEALDAEMQRLIMDSGILDARSPEELDRLLNELTLGMEEKLRVEASTQIRAAYAKGVDYVSRDIKAFVAFGGRHEAAVAAITEGEALTRAFKGFTFDANARIREVVTAAFEDGRVSTYEIAQNLSKEVGGWAKSRLDVIARTETYIAFEQGKENTFRDIMDERGEEFLFRFAGPQDPRTSPQCREIHRRVGNGVSLDEYNGIIAEVSQDPKHGGRPQWDPYRGRTAALSHPQCRHARIRTK